MEVSIRHVVHERLRYLDPLVIIWRNHLSVCSTLIALEGNRDAAKPQAPSWKARGTAASLSAAGPSRTSSALTLERSLCTELTTALQPLHACRVLWPLCTKTSLILYYFNRSLKTNPFYSEMCCQYSSKDFHHTRTYGYKRSSNLSNAKLQPERHVCHLRYGTSRTCLRWTGRSFGSSWSWRPRRSAPHRRAGPGWWYSWGSRSPAAPPGRPTSGLLHTGSDTGRQLDAQRQTQWALRHTDPVMFLASCKSRF